VNDADDELAALVAEALERRDRGEPLDLDALCAGRRDLVEGVRQALGIAAQLPALQIEAATRDRHLGVTMGGRYVLEERIGAGSMGVVYRGVDRELGRPVAVKVLAPDCMVEAEARARFLREAEVLAAVVHPAVVVVHDRGTTSADDHFLVMELLHGASGSQWLERAREAAAVGGLPALDDPVWLRTWGRLGDLPEAGWLRSVVRWTAELADGLAAAHAAGVRHRDVKPSNVFVRQDGRPVLLDFGIATRGAEGTLALRDKLVGTPAFLAPELLAPGSGGGSVASDVYGLGATLYSLLTLQPPYAGSLPEVLAQVAQRDPVPAARLRPLPRDLAAILDHALERDPRRRYPTAAALAADLRAFLAHRPVTARPISGAARLWRRLARSREVRAAVVVVAIGLGATAVASWRRVVVHREDVRAAAVWATLPPVLQLSAKVEQRPIADAAERARIAAALDAVVGGAADPLPATLLRAAFRLDHGDGAGAAADMAAVARLADTPYARAFAAWYASGEASLVQPVPAQALGVEPQTPADRHVAAFHAARAERTAANVQRGIELLLPDATTGSVAAVELLGLLLLASQLYVDEAARIEVCRQLYDTALRLDQRPGGATATTAYLLASALTGQKRAREALPHFRRGLALAPGHAGMHTNHGAALRQLGHADAAVEALREGIRLRPDVRIGHEHLVWALLDSDRFDEASAVVEAMPLPASDVGAQQRSLLRGRVEVTRAVRALAAADREGAVAAARRALHHYELAPLSSAAAIEAQLAQGLVADDTSVSFSALLQWLAAQPLARRRIEDLIALMPTQLGPEHVEPLRDWLQALVRHLAPLPEPAAGEAREPLPPSLPTETGR
jgi:tetratricopeptide (TPR) repeat protein